MSTKAEKLGKKALTKFTKVITDQFFLFLENDAHLLKEYKAAVKEGTQQSVNSVLGKIITDAYHLENIGIENNPECMLLKKYTKHKVQLPKKKLITDDVPERYRGSNLFAEPKVKEKKPPVKKVSKNMEETELF